jgi:outer membrane protein TolC
MNQAHVVFWCLIIQTPLATAGGPEPAQILIAEVIANHPKIKAVDHAIEAMMEERTLANALEDPQIQMAWMASEIETRLGPQEHKIALKQALPWPGKRQKKVAIVDQRLAHYLRKRESMVRELTSQTWMILADWYFLEQSIETTERHLAILYDFEQVLMEKYQNARATYDDLLLVQLEQDHLKDKISRDRLGIKVQQARLRAMLSLSEEELFPMELSGMVLPFDPSWHPDRCDLVHSPLLRQQHLLEEEQRQRLELEEWNNRPDFLLGLEWIGIGNGSLPDQNQRGRDAWVVSLGIKVPVWQEKNEARIAMAARRLDESKAQTRDLHDGLQAEFHQLRLEWEEALRQQERYRSHILPKAEERLKVLLQSLASNRAPYQEVLEAERALLEFCLTYEQAKVQQFKAETRLKRFVN